MTGELYILIIATIVKVFHVTNSQPSTLKRIWATANEHCRARNEVLVSFNNLNDTRSSSTDLPVRRIWSTVDERYTTWIAYIGCFEIDTMPLELIQRMLVILNNTVQGCYLECQKNISCGQNKPVNFVIIKESICLCVCKIQTILSDSSNCNESCSSDVGCHSASYFNAYTEYMMEKTRPGGFCLVCSEINLKANDFGCDEPFGLCAEKDDVCYGIKKKNGNLNYSKLHCTQQLPLVCVKQKDTNDHITNITTVAANFSACNPRPVTNANVLIIIGASILSIATSVTFFFVVYHGVMRKRWISKIRCQMHAKPHRENDTYETHLEEFTSEQYTSIDSNLQNVYRIIEPTTENNCNPEANHYYDRIKHIGQKKPEYQYGKVL